MRISVNFGIGKELTNLAALAVVGYTASRRLLDAECISHDPADGAAALEAITSPVIITTCTRVPGCASRTRASRLSLAPAARWRSGPPASPAATCGITLLPSSGKPQEDMTSGQIRYDLRRLRAHQIIERIPRSRTYQVTADGLTVALFLTRLTQRVLIPSLAQLTGTGPPADARLRQADRACKAAITGLAQQASLAA